MALNATILADAIDTNLTSLGGAQDYLLNGTNYRILFSNLLAQGIVNSIVNKTFETVDTGVPGSGVGTGTGILGLSPTDMASIALGVMSSQGPKAAVLMQSIMTAAASHLASSANLQSNSASVLTGSGTIVVGSINVSSSEMATNIETLFTTPQNLGGGGAISSIYLTNLCLAVSTGICTNILTSGTGTLVIAPGPPIPSNIIS